jgi:hypothetical protein
MCLACAWEAVVAWPYAANSLPRVPVLQASPPQLGAPFACVIWQGVFAPSFAVGHLWCLVRVRALVSLLRGCCFWYPCKQLVAAARYGACELHCTELHLMQLLRRRAGWRDWLETV